jgi:hypothetical protein
MQIPGMVLSTCVTLRSSRPQATVKIQPQIPLLPPLPSMAQWGQTTNPLGLVTAYDSQMSKQQRFTNSPRLLTMNLSMTSPTSTASATQYEPSVKPCSQIIGNKAPATTNRYWKEQQQLMVSPLEPRFPYSYLPQIILDERTVSTPEARLAPDTPTYLWEANTSYHASESLPQPTVNVRARLPAILETRPQAPAQTPVPTPEPNVRAPKRTKRDLVDLTWRFPE